MSTQNGDRARANKQKTKRRLRRSQIHLLRRLSLPAAKADGVGPALGRTRAD